MTIYLLDANVLIALVDRLHVFHRQAENWFSANRSGGWATCPLTENAVLRVVGNPSYRNVPGPPLVAAVFLGELIALPGHRFWPDDISLLRSRHVVMDQILTPAQITDTYLLALAVAHGGSLATFDRRLVTDAVVGGAAAVHLIDAA